MTSPAPESDPSAHQSASDADDGRLAAGRSELRLLAVPGREDAGAAAGAVAVRSAGELGVARGAGVELQRLRAAPPVQLELVSGRRDDRLGVVWASFPAHSRERVLVLLTRLIDAGALEQEA